MNHKKRNILVVGANSFVGHHLLVELKLDSFNSIVGVYHSNTENLHADIVNISIDDIDKQSNNFDEIYLISAFIPEKNNLNPEERILLFESNVALVNRICSLFSNAKIIFCSSVSVYTQTDQIINESSNIGGLNEYGISKLWAEKIVEKHANYAVLRFSSIYGEGMKTNTFLPNCIKQAINNNEIIVYGNGERHQDYIHVSDVVAFLKYAAQYQNNGIFLGVSGKSYSNIEIATIISQQTGCNITFKNNDNSPSFIYNNDYTCNTLSYKAEMNITDGIESLIKWIKKS